MAPGYLYTPAALNRLRIALVVSLAVAAVALVVVFVSVSAGFRGTVTSTSSTAATTTAGAITTVEPAAPRAQAGSAAPEGFVRAKPPKEFATFAKDFASFGRDPSTQAPGRAWYPSVLPAGFAVDVVDLSEMQVGSGPLCDITYVKGEGWIGFTQGSPTMRDYEIAVVETVPWGSEKAAVTYEDPEDATSRRYIVYSVGRNLVELSGDVTFQQLKQIAAGMAVAAP